MSPADLLLSAIDERRPIVLILGQDAWADDGDTVLVKAIHRLGHDGHSKHGWAALLGATAIPKDFYDWLADRFARRVHPGSVEALTRLPWSAVFTSSLDPTLKMLLERGREPEVVLAATEAPPAARSKVRPPLYYLFSRAGEHDSSVLPPATKHDLNTRRTNHAIPLLNRVLETATTLGLVIVDGIAPGRDWLKLDDLLGIVGGAARHQVIWCGGRPRAGNDLDEEFDAAVRSSRIVVEPRRLGTLIAELHALERLPDTMLPAAEHPGSISIGDGRRLETPPEERLRVEAVASIVDDSWTDSLEPLGEDSEYATFRRFHGAVEGPRLLVEGVRRRFAIERDFERLLLRRISSALADHTNTDNPIVVEGQSGTGKSVALARAVVHAREKRRVPVLYALGRIPRSQEVARFCELADTNGAPATLIVCDANRELDEYHELLTGLRSLGRRIVVLGSQYCKGHRTRAPSYPRVSAPNRLSDVEIRKLQKLLGRYGMPSGADLPTEHILAFLYRCLPASRPRIRSGLAAEAKSTQQQIRSMGRISLRISPITLLHQKLIKAGIVDTHVPLLPHPKEHSSSDSEDPAARLIDFVMVTGSLNCDLPFDLLIRAVMRSSHDTDLSSIVGLFRSELDLIRWRPTTSNDDTLFVGPRLTLEAELLCEHRLGGVSEEMTRLLELIESVRDRGLDNRRDERRFLVDLLRQLGPDGLRGGRYQPAYVKIASALTKLREKHGVLDAGLMIQESAFRRYAIRDEVVDQRECLPLLEKARDVIQTALDGAADGSIEAARRAKGNLLVERATIYGYLARNRVERRGTAAEIWSAYTAARTAVGKAVKATTAYYPLDVGLWTPSDILRSDILTELQKADLQADIYSTLDQVEPTSLPPQQREKFYERQMKVGTVLGDCNLTDHAFSELKESGSTAGYFLRARQHIDYLSRDTVVVDKPEDMAAVKRAADFLNRHLTKIKDDPRCLWLLLECRWIGATGRWPFRGQRQPIPVDKDVRRDLLEIVRALNSASGSAARHLPRYIEAMLTWLIDDGPSANALFRELDKDTEHEFGGRVVSRHLITDAEGAPCRFEGRIERDRGGGKWSVWVDDIRRRVDLMSRHFPNDHVAYGRTIRSFGISFNFIGPIADPVR